MGFSLTHEEIKELCRKKLREVLGMQPRLSDIHLVAYDVYDDGKTLQWIDFNLYNPNFGILVKYHINWDRNEILVTGDDKKGDHYLGGFLKHNGRY
jgi:hypothetical protein